MPAPAVTSATTTRVTASRVSPTATTGVRSDGCGVSSARAGAGEAAVAPGTLEIARAVVINVATPGVAAVIASVVAGIIVVTGAAIDIEADERAAGASAQQKGTGQGEAEGQGLNKILHTT